MDIDALKTFLEVNRTRHFGQAAENLYLSQSAVSARIRLLEEEVGIPLFTRQRNNIELTAAGQKLLHYAENILVTWHRAKQEIGVNDEKQAPLVIGCMPSLWEILLHELTGYLHDSLPNLAIHTEVHNHDILLRRIKEATFDLTFCFDYPQNTELEVVEVMQIPLVMVSSKPLLDISQALSYDYMLVDWGSSFAIAHAKQFPDMPSPFMRLGLGRMAKDVLLSEGGSAYLAEPMITSELRNKSLFRVKDAPVINRTAYAVFATDNEKTEIISHALHYFEIRNSANVPELVSLERSELARK